MIPSLDTHVYETMEMILKDLLRKEELTRDSLQALDRGARENFIRAFCGESPAKEVEFSYAFPQEKENFDARIVVRLGPSSMGETSIGNVEDTYEQRETGARKEFATVEHLADEGLMAIEVNHPIGRINGLENLQFAASDNVRIEGNRILFSAHPHNIDMAEKMAKKKTGVVVHYTSKVEQEEDPIGVRKGYTARETVDVIPISTNIDTVRCLDAMLKAVVILMGEVPAEKNRYQLQNHSHEGIIDQELNMDRMVFGRPMNLRYTVSTSVEMDFVNRVKEIVWRKGISDLGN